MRGVPFCTRPFGSFRDELLRAADAADADAVTGAWEAGWLPADPPEIARRRMAGAAARGER